MLTNSSNILYDSNALLKNNQSIIVSIAKMVNDEQNSATIQYNVLLLLFGVILRWACIINFIIIIMIKYVFFLIRK